MLTGYCMDVLGVRCELQLLSPCQLQEHPFLEDIISLVNNAYVMHFQGLIPGLGAIRVKQTADLVNELTPSGVCCAMFALRGAEADAKDMHVEKWPVAAANIKPYSPVFEHFPVGSHISTNTDMGGRLEGQSGLEGIQLDWEVTAVAVRQDKCYVGRGFAAACIAELERYIYSKAASAIRKLPPSEIGCMELLPQMTIWARTIQEINGSYWTAKGYKEHTVYRCPKGLMGAVDDFHLTCLVKQFRF